MDSEQQPDFIATVSYLPAEKGGLKIPVTSGFRSKIKFEYNEKQTVAEQMFMDAEFVYPGDTIETEIRLLSPQLFENMLTAGTSFDFSLNDKIVGTGIIKEIMNNSLRK